MIEEQMNNNLTNKFNAMFGNPDTPNGMFNAPAETKSVLP